MGTSDPSATYVSWNPEQNLETKISVSRLGIRQLGNYVYSFNDPSLD
jgi:hypothetical protein